MGSLRKEHISCGREKWVKKRLREASKRISANCIGNLSWLLLIDGVGLPDSWYIYCLDILSCLLPSSHIKHEDSHYGVLK